MSAPAPPRQPSDALSYCLALLILLAAFGAYMLPSRSTDAVTFMQGPTAAPALLPETPTPAATPVSHTAPPAAPANALTPASRNASGQAATPSDLTAVTYVLNTNTRRFHLPGCASVSEIKAKNRVDFTGTREELIGQGYVPCGRCKP